MWRNGEFKVKLEPNTIREFERVMLSSGECSLFMPMGFISEEDGETVCYDCSGFSPLSSYRIERTDDALYILERVLLIAGNSVEYLITPSRIALNMNTVFYNKETGEVKIAYVPLKQETVSLRKNLVAFIELLKRELCDGHESYLTEASRYIRYHNYYLRDMVNKVSLFRRMLYAEEHPAQ